MKASLVFLSSRLLGESQRWPRVAAAATASGTYREVENLFIPLVGACDACGYARARGKRKRGGGLRQTMLDKGLDVAVRIGSLPESGLVARRVGTVHRMIVASPTYLAARGTPQSISDKKIR